MRRVSVRLYLIHIVFNIDQTARLYRANDGAVIIRRCDDDDWHYCDARAEISSGIGSDSVLGVYCITIRVPGCSSSSSSSS